MAGCTAFRPAAICRALRRSRARAPCCRRNDRRHWRDRGLWKRRRAPLARARRRTRRRGWGGEAGVEASLELGGSRVATVALPETSRLTRGAPRRRRGGAHMAFDMVGGAQDPNATLAALKSLGRGGRLVLMGSMGVPLPISYLEVMLNDLEILGQFMYPQDAFMRLVDLACAQGTWTSKRSGRVSFRWTNCPPAMDAAAAAGSLECVVVEDHRRVRPGRQSRHENPAIRVSALCRAQRPSRGRSSSTNAFRTSVANAASILAETGAVAAKVEIYVSTGSAEALTPVRHVHAIFYVNSLDEFCAVAAREWRGASPPAANRHSRPECHRSKSGRPGGRIFRGGARRLKFCAARIALHHTSRQAGLRGIAELEVDRTDAADGDDGRLVVAANHAVVVRRQGDATHVAAG